MDDSRLPKHQNGTEFSCKVLGTSLPQGSCELLFMLCAIHVMFSERDATPVDPVMPNHMTRIHGAGFRSQKESGG